jgi:sugar phosphate isomerase/epimerase
VALTSSDLVCSWWTIAGATPGSGSPRTIAERAEAAARAGFAGIGLRNDDYTLARAAGLSDADIANAIRDNGLVLDEIEFVTGWSSDDPAQQARGRQVEQDLYALADATGARQLNVGSIEPLGSLPPLEAVAGRFGALCGRAAAHGLQVALEFMPWTGIPGAALAWEVVRQAGAANGGVLVDTWHYFRGAADPAQLRDIPTDRIFGLQINDADREVVGALREDSLRRRRLPGRGSFDLTGFVRLMDELGVQAPYAVEVISDEQTALALDDAARSAFEATASVLKAARS